MMTTSYGVVTAVEREGNLYRVTISPDVEYYTRFSGTVLLVTAPEVGTKVVIGMTNA
jgi:hypothetical protein